MTNDKADSGLMNDLCELIEDWISYYTFDKPTVTWESFPNKKGSWPGVDFVIFPKTRRDCARLLGPNGANADSLREQLKQMGRRHQFAAMLSIEQPHQTPQEEAVHQPDF